MLNHCDIVKIDILLLLKLDYRHELLRNMKLFTGFRYE